MTTVPVQRYARLAGILFLISFAAGGFGEAYVPSKLIVSTDAAATARNILGSLPLFRLGFAGFLVESLCDVGLTWAFYVLLRPVHRDLALLAVFLRIISTAGFAMAEVPSFAATRILGGADYLKTFSPDQLHSLALLSLKVSGFGQVVFSIHFGAAAVVLGYLIFRSGYLPRIIGVLFAIGGLGFVVETFATVLAPAFASPLLVVPILIGGLLLAVWLLVKGVNVTKWRERVADARAAPSAAERS